MTQLLDGHEIGDFGDAIFGEETGEQHVGVGHVELLVAGIPEQADASLKLPPFAPVQQRGKNGRGIEVGEAHEIDGPIDAHQGDGVQIANNTIIGDGLVMVVTAEPFS